MNVEINSFSYQEIDQDALNKSLEENGMVFVHLKKWHARAYIRYQKNSLVIEESRRYDYGRWKVLFYLILSLLRLPWVAIFHSKLLTLDSLRIINDLRCSWETEENGMYRFTFS